MVNDKYSDVRKQYFKCDYSGSYTYLNRALHRRTKRHKIFMGIIQDGIGID